MKVFTIFCHGTNFNRTKEGELIAEFGRQAEGEEYRDYLILEGPGSSGSAAAKMPGAFNPFTRNRESKSWLTNIFQKKEMGYTSINSRLAGLAGGSGWDDNVMHAVAAVSELTETGPRGPGVSPASLRINMMGWSRGAITCGKIAFALREIYPQVEINIFAVDPVAGFGNNGAADVRTIRSNVRNYLCILSVDENRGFFQPQDLTSLEFTHWETNRMFLPFPGTHSDQVKLDESWHKGKPEAAQIVWDLAGKFMKHFGTRFKKLNYGDHLMLTTCSLYASLNAKRSDYVGKKSLGRRVQGGVGDRDVKVQAASYTDNSRYFLNEHHRRVFMRVFPNLYAYTFEGRPVSDRMVRNDCESAMFYRELGHFVESLGYDHVKGQLPLRMRRGGGTIDREQLISSLGAMGLYR